MRKISGFAAMAVLAVSGTYAQADSVVDGTFNFIQPSYLHYPLPTASFVWDSTTSKWKSFTVDWDGAAFNFAPLFPDLQDVARDGRWCGAGPDLKGCFAAGERFGLQLHAPNLGISPEQPTWTDLEALGYGGYTVKEAGATATTAVPEPTTLGLMVLGLLGAGFAGRKRRN